MDRYTRFSYPSPLKSQLAVILIFSCLILGSCNQRFVTVKPADNSASLKKPAITISSEDPSQSDPVGSDSMDDPDSHPSDTESNEVNHPAIFKFFAVNSKNQLITLDQKLPLTFCVQRRGIYRPLCKSLRSENDGADYSSRGQEGSPRSHSPAQGVNIEVETDPESNLGTEYYFSGYQPAGYLINVFQRGDRSCKIKSFTDIQGMIFSPYADARDAHLGFDNPKVFLKKNECVVVVFQYLTSPEIKAQYAAQSQIEMLQPENFSEWLSVSRGGQSVNCTYEDIPLKDSGAAPKKLPLCGTHHVFREDGGNSRYQLGMMIGLNSAFGGILTDFDLWWRNPKETRAQGVKQIAEISTPTDSGVQFTTGWSKWSSDALRQYDDRLNECAKTENGKIITSTNSVWNQLSGAVTKFDLIGWYHEKPTALTPCGREGGGFNWGFDVQLEPVKQGRCNPELGGKTYPNCLWTRGQKVAPLATDFIRTTVGSLDTTPAFFPFGSKPYLIAGTPELFMFTRRGTNSSVITAVHRMQRVNLIPHGLNYVPGGTDGQLGLGTWRAFKLNVLIDAKAYLVLVDTQNKKAAWAFDPTLKLDRNSKVPGTTIPILGNLGLEPSKGGGVLSNQEADAGAQLIKALCPESYSHASCKNGHDRVSQASIDRILFLYPMETKSNLFGILSLHRAEIQSGRTGNTAQVGYQPTSIFMSVNEKHVLFGGPFFKDGPQQLSPLRSQTAGLNGSIQYPASTFAYDYGFNEDLNDLSVMEAPAGY